MKHILAALLFFAAAARADVSPMDTALPEDKITLISCDYTAKEKYNGKAVAKGPWSYKVYIPKGYDSNKTEKYPCLFICSPSGNANLQGAAKFVKENKWLAIMLVESKNGPMINCVGNFRAAYDDAAKRLRLKQGELYITGFSGGARFASVAVGDRPGFAGLILQGAGLAQNGAEYDVQPFRKNKKLILYALFGEKDSNGVEINRVKKVLPKWVKNVFEKFPGGHTWAPEPAMTKALQWMVENNQMKPKSLTSITKK